MDYMNLADSKQELSDVFESYNTSLGWLDASVKQRILELRDPAEQDDLQAARAWLKLNSMIMYTSSMVIDILMVLTFVGYTDYLPIKIK